MTMSNLYWRWEW